MRPEKCAVSLNNIRGMSNLSWKKTWAAFLFLAAVQGGALDYADMEVIFRASSAPKASQLVGTWLGRCVHYSDPYTLWPAFYQMRPLSSRNKKQSLSQSHTWFNTQTNQYDSYTLDQLQKDPDCKIWLEKEQWDPIRYHDSSWVNTYQFPHLKMQRATRLYKDGLREHIVLAYSIANKPGEYPSSYCFFNVKLD